MATMTGRDKLRALLPHWIEHNAEHAAEFRLWAGWRAKRKPISKWQQPRWKRPTRPWRRRWPSWVGRWETMIIHHHSTRAERNLWERRWVEMIMFDIERCNGCGACVEVCPTAPSTWWKARRRWTRPSAATARPASPPAPWKPSAFSRQQRIGRNRPAYRFAGPSRKSSRCKPNPRQYLSELACCRLSAQPWPGVGARSCPAWRTIFCTIWTAARPGNRRLPGRASHAAAPGPVARGAAMAGGDAGVAPSQVRNFLREGTR